MALISALRLAACAWIVALQSFSGVAAPASAQPEAREEVGGQDVHRQQLIPSGPLRNVERLTRTELLEAPQPVLVHSAQFQKTLERAGLKNLDDLAKHYGDEELLFVAGETGSFLFQRRVKVKRYVQRLLDDGRRASQLPEEGGREFFLARPQLYSNVAQAYARLLPVGFREMLDVGSRESQKELTRAAEQSDFGVSDLTLWAGDKGHSFELHVDYITAILLTHLQGRKRVWLYPATQQGLLYLNQTGAYEGWGARSRMVGSPDSSRFPLSAEASPLVVDLQEGESLLIPCGWAHRVEYLGPALSISCAVHPDWLDLLLNDKPMWYPNGCAMWFREPCGPEGCDWPEL